MTIDAIGRFAPEILLAVAAAAMYVAGGWIAARGRWAWAAGAIIAAGTLLFVPSTAGDALAGFGRGFALLVGLGLVLLIARPRPGPEPNWLAALLLSVVGLMLSAAAANLVLLVLGLELVAIPTYLMLCLSRRDARSAVAAARYFFLGTLGLALLLYGLSFIYGMTGSLQWGTAQADTTAHAPLAGLAGVAVVFVVVGLGLKMGAAPFHFHVPDVCETATNTVAAQLVIVPAAAGLFVLARVLFAVPSLALDGCRLTAVLAVVGMALGNVMALCQDHLRRLLVYGSIAQTGYLLLGCSVALAAGAEPMVCDALAAVWFMLAAHGLAALGTFAALAYLGRADRQIDHVDELAGLARTHPALAAALAVLLLSAAGIAPLAGFWGKLALLGTVLEVEPAVSIPRTWFLALAVVAVLNMAASAAYYVRIVGVIYFRLPLGVLRAEGGHAARAVVFACALLTVAVGLHGGPLWRRAAEASRSARTNRWPNYESDRPNWPDCSTRSIAPSTFWTTN